MDYFISANGNDSNPGTEAKPWRNVQTIQGRAFSPGDRILLRKGDFWAVTGPVALYHSGGGVKGTPIAFDAYGSGPYPRVRGEGDAWTALKFDRPWLSVRHWQFEGVRNGAVASNAPGLDVRECVFANCGGHGFQLSRLDGPSPDAIVRNCQAKQIGGSGFSFTTEANLQVLFNYAGRCCMDEKAPADNFDMNYTAGLKIFGRYGETGVVIEGNVCEDNGNMVQTEAGVASISKGMGLWIDYCEAGAVIARYNLCRRNINSGIAVEITENQQIYSNRCYDNGLRYAHEPQMSPNMAGIVAFRGAHKNRIKYNVCFRNPWQTLLWGYPGAGAEGMPQDCNDNIWEQNTLLSRNGGAYFGIKDCDLAKNLRINEVEERI